MLLAPTRAVTLWGEQGGGHARSLVALQIDLCKVYEDAPEDKKEEVEKAVIMINGAMQPVRVSKPKAEWAKLRGALALHAFKARRPSTNRPTAERQLLQDLVQRLV